LENLGSPSLQLIRDVVTRWSSTYLMIERAIELKDVSKITFFFIKYAQLFKFRPLMNIWLNMIEKTNLHHLIGRNWKR